ncbi:MAG: hypothetical protein JNJ59_12690 [Deltaproteobacteria bacterium]|nr:hypothetical protein [Deltaproteobacteria bacterium]
MSILPRSLLVASGAMLSLACDSGDKGTTQECPAGSGAVFVQDGPNGPGCYCPAGTNVNETLTGCVACVPGEPCGECVDTDVGVTCGDGKTYSSLADQSGPYPHMQCAGSVGPEQRWFRTHTTSFPVDCRCPHGGGDGGQFCIAPSGQSGNHDGLGSGPSAADSPSGEIKGCATDFDRDVVYYGVNWADGGDNRRAFVFAMDPRTANRTLVSGEYADPVNGNFEKGAGESFDTILDMQLGKDGFLYVFEDSVPGTTSEDTSTLFGRSVYRVDLTSGDRELWWNDRDPAFAAAGCKTADGAFDIFNHQFELDQNDNFLFTTRDGSIVRVLNDRSKCEIVTTQLPIGPGSGVDVAFDSGWAYDKDNNAIYSTSFFGGLYKTDVATGHRSRLWGGPVGTGPGPGMWSFLYVPYLELWVAGGNELNTPSYAAIFDPASGDTWGWTYEQPNAETGTGSGGSNTFGGPINTNPTGMLRGPILGTLNQLLVDRPWCLSPIAEDRLFVATDKIGIVIVELQTGNTMNFSQ